MGTNALTIVRNQAITVRRDADVYHLAALVLSTLDRVMRSGIRQEISRIQVIGRRVVILDLPLFSVELYGYLNERDDFGARLTRLIGPNLIVLRAGRHNAGIQLIFDLAAAAAPRRDRSSLIWCADCGQLMAYDHAHQA